MKRLRIVVALLAIAMMLGSTAWALNGDDHVKVAPNGKGDLMFFPWFLVGDGGIQSKLTVINTSNDYSVVAKVVYRSFNWSAELLDHLIYLSPNDVWVAELKMVNGKATLVCTDDSMLGSTTEFADKVPVSQALATPAQAGTAWDFDSNTFGYIEVIESAAAPVSVLSKTDGKVAKSAIKEWYDKAGTTPVLFPPVNVLTGYQENSNGLNNTFVRARVFADYLNTAKLSVLNETFLGQDANNTLAELEAAMSNYDVALPYLAKATYDWTFHFFSFPTKMSARNSTAPETYKPNTIPSPYWTLVGEKCEKYTFDIYDLKENSPTTPGVIFSPYRPGDYPEMCYEVNVNFIAYQADTLFTEGWVRYNWANGPAAKAGLTQDESAISYVGTPVFSSAVIFNGSGWAEAESAYSFGQVGVGGAVYDYYPYSEGPEPNVAQ